MKPRYNESKRLKKVKDERNLGANRRFKPIYNLSI